MSLLLLQLKGAFVFEQVAAGAAIVDYSTLNEAEAMAISSKKEGLWAASEGGVGFYDEEFGDEGVKLTPADFEQIELMVEDDSVEDTAGLGASGPTMERAEVVHGNVGGMMMEEMMKGRRGGIPNGAKEVRDMVPLKKQRGRDGKRSKEPEEEHLQVGTL